MRTEKTKLTPQPLCRLPLGPLHPRINSPLPLRLLPPNNALQNLPNKAHKIAPAQRIFPSPSSPLPLLGSQRLNITNLARPNPQILHNSHKIKPRLGLGVPRNPPLQHPNHLLGKCLRITGPMRDRRRLQPVKLVQLPVHGRVRDEVVYVSFLVFILGTACLIDKWTGLGECIVGGADCFGV